MLQLRTATTGKSKYSVRPGRHDPLPTPIYPFSQTALTRLGHSSYQHYISTIQQLIDRPLSALNLFYVESLVTPQKLRG